MPERPQIAITVITKGDPLWVDTRRITRALEKAGFLPVITELDWAGETEWENLTSPTVDNYGRHAAIRITGDHIVTRTRDGRWFRTMVDPDALEARDEEIR